jgi:SnoaL-like domain
MSYNNEAIVRNAYHTAEGNVLDIPGWTGSFTEDGVFNNISGEESYRGEHLKDIVIIFAKMFPDVHRELHRVNVMGDVIAIELSIQGTFRGPMETPAGVIQPTGAKVNIPCADCLLHEEWQDRAIRLLSRAQHHAQANGRAA